MESKKNILTYEGLRKYEDELHDLKVIKRKEVAQKIKEAREQGDLSENAEYDAAKDEQRDIEARIDELEKILKNAANCLFFFVWHSSSPALSSRWRGGLSAVSSAVLKSKIKCRHCKIA